MSALNSSLTFISLQSPPLFFWKGIDTIATGMPSDTERGLSHTLLGCRTSLANRLLASRSAFWGTEGTTVLLCREIWDSCTHTSQKQTCIHDMLVMTALYSHQILAQQEITNKKQVNERKQKSEIQRNRWVSNDYLRIWGKNWHGARRVSKQSHMCFKQQQ